MTDCSSNTEEIIQFGDEIIKIDEETQTEINPENASTEEVYGKLDLMLHEMGIDS